MKIIIICILILNREPLSLCIESGTFLLLVNPVLKLNQHVEFLGMA